MSGPVEVIEMQPLPPVIGPGEHAHFCPECYGYEPCSFSCACPADLTREDGTRCGSPANCERCSPIDHCERCAKAIPGDPEVDYFGRPYCSTYCENLSLDEEFRE